MKKWLLKEFKQKKKLVSKKSSEIIWIVMILVVVIAGLSVGTMLLCRILFV